VTGHWPSDEEVLSLTAHARSVVALSRTVRGHHRRRTRPDDPVRRAKLAERLGSLKEVSESLRRERIRASRCPEFDEQFGATLWSHSDLVKRERYKVYRMLNPGGQKWTP
jgi:hypothetical protein